MLDKKINTLRKKMGLTQAEFAAKIGARCRQASISGWESGKQLPSMIYFRRLIALGKRNDIIFTKEEWVRVKVGII